MREFFKITLITTAILVAFAACRDNEDNITPSGNYSPIRGGFPQGNSEYDSIILDIKNEFGVYLLYKDVTEEDMNRTWVSAGTGDIYVAGDSIERDNGSWNLPDEHLPLYVDFFRNYIFPNITKEFAHSTFPVKIYMINNLRTEPRFFGDEDEEDSEEKNEEEDIQQGTDTNPNKIIKLGDFDNWAISFPDSVINGTNPEYALKQLRSIFMINVIKNSIDKGEITAPNGFWEAYDFKKSSTCDTDKDHSKCTMVNVVDKNADNHIYKIGYVDVLESKFGTGRISEVIKNVDIKKGQPLHTDNWTANINPTWDMFEAYIMNAMWFTPEEFNERYQPEINTIIKEQYELVVSHMLDEYGINLVGIAYGLQESSDTNDDN